MRIKRILTMLVFCFYFLFLNYTIDAQSIRFNRLSSKTFTLDYVFYMTMFDESNIKISEIFASLPIHKIVEEIEARYSRYGVSIDTSLFSNSEKNVSQIKSYDLAMRNFFIHHETEETQILSISFNRLTQNDLVVEVRLRIIENGRTVSRSEFITSVPHSL